MFGCRHLASVFDGRRSVAKVNSGYGEFTLPQPYRTNAPPSTLIVCPVTKLLSSEPGW